MRFLLLVLGALALAVYIPEKLCGYTLKAVFKKSIVSVLFVAVAASSGSSAPLAPFVIVGLTFGLLGDIWLDLKYVFPLHDELLTYAGFFVFGIGHILYITGLIRQYGTGRFLVLSFALAAIAAGMVAAMERPMKLVYGRMRKAVILYGFALFSTVFVSGNLLLSAGGMALRLFFTGGVMFAVSDLILSGTYFGTGKDRPADIIANYLFYYGGQFLIAYSLMFV